MQSYVNGFYSDGQRVALVRKSKPDWQRGRLNGIGGKIEASESPLAAMVREFEEETGCRTNPEQWRHTVLLRGADFTVYFFAATGPSFVAVGLPDEPIEWHHWMQLPPTAIPNLRWLIPLSFDRDLRTPIELYDHNSRETK